MQRSVRGTRAGRKFEYLAGTVTPYEAEVIRLELRSRR
jgi:hypothetical protein